MYLQRIFKVLGVIIAEYMDTCIRAGRAHLAQVKNRSRQREARFRIYKGKLTQGGPFPPRGKKKSVTHVRHPCPYY